MVRIVLLVVPSMAATVGLCEDPHPSRNMNHMFSLEVGCNLDIFYPRALLSDKRSNTNFMPFKPSSTCSYSFHVDAHIPDIHNTMEH